MPQKATLPMGAPPLPSTPPPAIPTRPPMPSLESLPAVIRKHEEERRQAEATQKAPEAGHPPFHPGPSLRKMTDAEINAMKEKQTRIARDMILMRTLEQQKILTSKTSKIAFLNKSVSGKAQPINGF